MMDSLIGRKMQTNPRLFFLSTLMHQVDDLGLKAKFILNHKDGSVEVRVILPVMFTPEKAKKKGRGK